MMSFRKKGLLLTTAVLVTVTGLSVWNVVYSSTVSSFDLFVGIIDENEVVAASQQQQQSNRSTNVSPSSVASVDDTFPSSMRSNRITTTNVTNDTTTVATNVTSPSSNNVTATTIAQTHHQSNVSNTTPTTATTSFEVDEDEVVRVGNNHQKNKNSNGTASSRTNTSNSNNNKTKKKFAYVCIVGVLGDLELDDMLSNLFIPLRDAEYELDVTMMLQNDLINTTTAANNTSVYGINELLYFIPNREPINYNRSIHYIGGRPIPSDFNYTKQHDDMTTSSSSTSQDIASLLYHTPFPSYNKHFPNFKIVRKWVSHRNHKFRSKQQVLDYLESYNLTTTTTDNIKNHRRHAIEIYPPLINPPVTIEYVTALAKRDGFVNAKKLLLLKNLDKSQRRRDIDSSGKGSGGKNFFVKDGKIHNKRIFGTSSSNKDQGNIDGEDNNSYGTLRRDHYRRIMWRCVNDVRLLHAYSQCYTKSIHPKIQQRRQQQKQNDEESVVNDDDDSIIVVAGEDSILGGNQQTSTFDIKKIVSTMKYQQQQQTNSTYSLLSLIKSIPCATQRGHDWGTDKIDFLPTHAAEKYFMEPLRRFYETNIFGDQVNTLSGYLQKVYSEETKTPQANAMEVNEDDDQNEKNKISPFSPIPYPLSANDGFPAESQEEKQLLEPLNEHQKKRVFVCVTGQLGRLELENKLKTVYEPFREAGYTVDTALVLSERKAIFQKKKGAIKGNFNYSSYSPQQVADWFERHNLTLVSNVTYEPNWNLPINPQYAMIKDGTFKPNKDRGSWTLQYMYDVSRGGIMSNFIMIQSYTRCWDAYKQLQQKSQQRQYRFHFRMRDDLGFYLPWNISEIETQVGPTSLMTSTKLTNGGLNDRMAILGSEVAKCYYMLPYLKFYDDSLLCHANTETHFKYTYWSYRCSEGAKTDMFPAKMLGGQFCQDNKCSKTTNTSKQLLVKNTIK